MGVHLLQHDLCSNTSVICCVGNVMLGMLRTPSLCGIAIRDATITATDVVSVSLIAPHTSHVKMHEINTAKCHTQTQCG